MRDTIRVDGFEAVFAEHSDPWGTYQRRDEAVKRQAILRAAGRTRGRALELACGNGSNTCALQRHSLRLLALDGAPSAVRITRERACSPRVDVREALLPIDAPREPFDLIVIAEVLYYLRASEIAQLARRLRLAPGGRLVLAHHHIDFPDTSSRPAEVHAMLRAGLAQRVVPVSHTRNSRWRVEGLAAPR